VSESGEIGYDPDARWIDERTLGVVVRGFWSELRAIRGSRAERVWAQSPWFDRFVRDVIEDGPPEHVAALLNALVEGAQDDQVAALVAGPVYSLLIHRDEKFVDSVVRIGSLAGLVEPQRLRLRSREFGE
jgi:hypothetical protein